MSLRTHLSFCRDCKGGLTTQGKRSLPEMGCLIGTAVKEMEERREAKHSAHLVFMDKALLNPRLFVMV